MLALSFMNKKIFNTRRNLLNIYVKNIHDKVLHDKYLVCKEFNLLFSNWRMIKR